MRYIHQRGSSHSRVPQNVGIVHRSQSISPSLMRLDDLIIPGRVERGFYVASGGWELVKQVQERLVDLLWSYSLRMTQDSLVEEEEEHQSLEPRSYRRSSRIGQLIWVDSGNLFDPYYMSTMARKRGLDPLRVLRSVKVGRPFTAFQFQQMLQQVPNAALWACQSPNQSWGNTVFGRQACPPAETPTSPELTRGRAGPPAETPTSPELTRGRAGPPSNSSLSTPLTSLFSRSLSLSESSQIESRSPNAVWWTPLVIISDLMGLFYDSELPEEDLYRAFREFLLQITHLRSRAIVLALSPRHVVPPARRHLLPEVLHLSRRISVEPCASPLLVAHG